MPDKQNERPTSPPQGDDRTPDKTQGQIKYAQGQTKKTEGRDAMPSQFIDAIIARRRSQVNKARPFEIKLTDWVAGFGN